MLSNFDAGLWAGYLLAVFASLSMLRTIGLFLPATQSRLFKGAAGVVLWLVFCLPAWIGDENILLIFPLLLAAICLCFRGPWYARTVTGTLFYTLLLPVSILLDTSFEITLHIYDRTLLSHILKLAVWLGIALLARRLVRGSSGPIQLSPGLWALIGGLSLAPLFTTLSFSIWNMRIFGEDVYYSIMQRLCYTTLPFTLLSAIALLIALAVLSRHEALQQENRLAELQRLYYQGLQNEQAEVRALRHDMHNHITAAEGLLAENKPAAAHAYLQALTETPALTGSIRLCGNEAANAVLAAKMALIRREGLTADWQLTLPESLPLPAIDLCTLLGNALDNAIEAAKNTQDKTIHLRARADKGTLMLQVRNALPEGRQPQRKQGHWPTTKPAKRDHGLGIPSMQAVAGRYGGSIEARAENGHFELTACIPLPE